MMTLTCFKAYDIRGRVPEDLNTDIAWRIGRAYADVVTPGSVVVGFDARLESPDLAEALISGLTSAGVNVINIGLCGTEEVYFQTANREAQGIGGGIMVTASHNPKGTNGMKLVRRGSRPISGDTGLNEIRDRVAALSDVTSPSAATGTVTHDPDKSAYIAHLLSYLDLTELKPLTILADPGNGCAGPIITALAKHLPFHIIPVRGEPDGTFPDGIPNPLLPEMRDVTAEAVRQHKADFGIAWDGDCDRCFLFDAQGNFIEGYYLVGLLAEAMLVRHPGAKIIHDPRLIWSTIADVTRCGGIAVQCKTGHAFIKERMRAEDAIYGGEMSGHHYFRDFSYCDSGMIPWLLIAAIVCRSGLSLAELVNQRMESYPCSGEINFETNAQAATQRILDHYLPLAQNRDDTDGIGLTFSDWRFNLRQSNTEPLLRLNIETRGDVAAVDKHLKHIRALIDAATSLI
ncbi:MAG: phosphomannomutase CpsG [Rhodospirillaceae bacterium]|nr:phosphomannomutase CpsG [Rhodospirillaceae bacterium]